MKSNVRKQGRPNFDTELDDDIVVEIDGVGVKIDVKAVKGADGNDYYYDSTKSFLN